MAWDGKLVNRGVYPKGTSVNVRKLPGTDDPILKTVPSGQKAGTATGATITEPDGLWYQVLFDDGKTYGYVRNDVVTLESNDIVVAEKDAKSMIDSMIANDVQINSALIRMAVILANLKKNGVDTSQYDKTYATIQASWNNRQNKIRNSKLLAYKTGFQKDYEKLLQSAKPYVDYLEKNRMSIPIGNISGSIGALPLIAGVILVIIGAGLATGAYFAFKPDYDKGAADLKMTKELETALSKVDPNTAAKIKDQLGKQIDEAYNQGKTQQKIKDILSWPLLLGLGILGYMAFQGHRSNSKSNK